MATSSNLFTLDIESIKNFKQTNKSVLVQIQIFLPHNSSAILIFEMCRLPSEHTTQFTLMNKFFEILFNDKNTIYIWGEIKELILFTNYKLFSEAQCHLANIQNLQNIFKTEWQKLHPHILSNKSSNELSNDLPNEFTNVYVKNEWVDKRPSASSFDIGLDTNLFHMNELEQQYRNQLTTYAANDYLSMQRILINDLFTIQTTVNKSNAFILNHELLSEDIQIIIKKKINELSREERKRIHNRSYTLKQRKKLYQHEIIIHYIDHRFTITNIKTILRQNSVAFSAVNTSTSSRTNRRTLYIGTKHKHLLSEYEQQIKYLFTTEHYKQFKRFNRSSYKDDRHSHHHRDTHRTN
ncbi:unnamed protein product [Rotaria sordida]|uniref:Uncharacterized protein n=1 Tax=Rotaria sordida TaxID=392033 RepID=A0A818REE8_9BILA|nr:unnamed protein product [Rotaria sordida]CAF4161328.1 unnamed protein product [Rotaria sordida]